MVDIAQITRTLNRVESVGQARAAAGAALVALNQGAYPLLGELSRFADVYDPHATRRRVDIIRGRIETWYPSAGSDTDPVQPWWWGELRQAISDAYHEIAGIEAAAGTVRGNSVDWTADLRDAVDAAAAVLAKTVQALAEAAGKLAGAAGEGAGKGAAAFLSEAWWVVLIALAAYFGAKRFGVI